MNRYFVSYFFTDKNKRQGYGRAEIKPTAKKLSAMHLKIAEDKIAEEKDFKEVIITNFIKL